MIHTLKNDYLEVEISEKGAELRSVNRKNDSFEYIWQGDPKYWEDRSPVLFPICSSLFEDSYIYDSKVYKMGMHGFAQGSDFSVIKKSGTELVLSISSNDTTRDQYPFEFEFEISYSLSGTELTVCATIKNKDSKVMPATFGAHPGFNLPLDEGASFEDYFIEFASPCTPEKIVLSKECYVTGECEKLELAEGRKIHLRHHLFIPDGIFMSEMAREVSLKSDKGTHFVTMKFDDMPYFGIWQKYSNDTPFLCLEPWCAPPTNDGKTHEDLSEKEGLFKIEPNEQKTVSYSIIFA